MPSRNLALPVLILLGMIVALLAFLVNSSGLFWGVVGLPPTAATQESTAANGPLLAPQPYSSSDGILKLSQAEPNIVPEGDPREPWIGAEAWRAGVQAGQEYIAENPEPQNVQVLTGMNTGEIWVYMQQHVSGALGVGCQYCHDIKNFAADPYPQKISARLMMRLVNDLNRDYMTHIPQWRGNYVQCATCHNTEAINLAAVSQQNNSISDNSPDDGSLLTAALDTPAVHPIPNYVDKHSTTGTMLAMVNYMTANWQKYVLPRSDLNPEELPKENRQYYIKRNEAFYNVPGCYTCHRGYTIPSAALNKANLETMDQSGSTYLPLMLRGVENKK